VTPQKKTFPQFKKDHIPVCTITSLKGGEGTSISYDLGKKEDWRGSRLRHDKKGPPSIFGGKKKFGSYCFRERDAREGRASLRGTFSLGGGGKTTACPRRKMLKEKSDDSPLQIFSRAKKGGPASLCGEDHGEESSSTQLGKTAPAISRKKGPNVTASRGERKGKK